MLRQEVINQVKEQCGEEEQQDINTKEGGGMSKVGK